MDQTTLIELIATLQPGQTLVVEAEAGSGKTWAVMQAIAKRNSEEAIAVVAPTHVAVNELRSKSVVDYEGLEFRTSASVVGRFLELNRSTGEYDNRFASTSLAYDLIAVDELSALPAVDLRRMLRSDAAIVLLGDHAQLPAVKSAQPAVWTDEWQEYEHRSFTYVTLTGQHRSAGKLYEVQKQLRDQDVPLTKSFDGCRVLYSEDEFVQDWLEAMRNAYESSKDLSQYCMLAYRNSTVARLQQLLRTEVFYSDNYVAGEVVRIAGSPFTWLPTGTLATVLNAEASQTRAHGYTIPTSIVHMRVSGEGDCFRLRCVHPSYATQYAELLQSLKDSQNWDAFFALEEQFSTLESANVMTVHKSQGRSIGYVWAHMQDIGTRQKLRYVAVSRAAKCLTTVWPYKEWAGATKKLLAGSSMAELNAMRAKLPV